MNLSERKSASGVLPEALRSLGPVDVVIPVLNEEHGLPRVLAEIPGFVRRVVVADNGSTDRTAALAGQAGAEVVFEAQRGYGAACLRALAHLAADPPDVVVFLDGDFSDDPTQMPALLEPIALGCADLVIGSRVEGDAERGALSHAQRVGNAIACRALRALYGVRYTDLGPFRAIRYSALMRLAMVDRDYGWTVEMQVKAARAGLAHAEVPVAYRRRLGGESKVSGTLRGVLGASHKILSVLLRHALGGAAR